MANQVKWNCNNESLRRRVFALTTLILMFSMRVYSEQKNSADSAASVQSFLGRWDLTLKTPLREYPSWLEITQEDGQLKARMVSRWGHARPLPKIEISNGRITFVSPKEEEDRKDDMVFEGKLSGKTLVGDHDRARWNSVAMDGRESAIPEEKECSEDGESRHSCSTAGT